MTWGGKLRVRRPAAWLEDDLPARFEERILPIDATVANAWGVVVAGARASGTTLGAMDALFQLDHEGGPPG